MARQYGVWAPGPGSLHPLFKGPKWECLRFMATIIGEYESLTLRRIDG